MQMQMFTPDPVFARMERIRHELGLNLAEHEGMTVLFREGKSIGVERVGDGLYVVWARGLGTYKRDAESAIAALEEFQW